MLTKHHEGRFVSGAQGLYTLTFTNKGAGTESGPIEIVDTLPAGLTLAAAEATANNMRCKTDASRRVVTCTSHAAQPHGKTEQVKLCVNISAHAGTTLTNTAAITGTDEPS